MNAIQDHEFTRCLNRLGQRLVRPSAILCISAHWMTQGTWVTHARQPRTIHDFYGFPKALFEVQYPALGSPEMAEKIKQSITDPPIQWDESSWGLDHGAWSVLKHLYPLADIPVVQLSLDIHQPPEFHFDLGRKLRFLRNEGVLIVGSGNIVHNLRVVDFSDRARPYPWAVEFDEWVKQMLIRRDYPSLMRQALSTEAGRLSVPTPDHWYPLLYVLGASDSGDRLTFEYEGIEHGSISMRCLSFE